MRRISKRFASGGETLAGELLLPDGQPPHPAVLLIGGTFSDTRDGDPALSLRGEFPAHGMFRVMAEKLAEAGLASFRWDRRGVGESTGGNRDEHSDFSTDAQDTEAAFDTLRNAPEIDPARVAVLGESAGAGMVCALASRTNLAAAYVLQGALHGTIHDLMAYNTPRLEAFIARGPEYAEWVQKNAPPGYKSHRQNQELIEAAMRGDEEYIGPDGVPILAGRLRRMRESLTREKASQFRHIQIEKPVLVIQGDRDLNVPPDDCHKVARVLREAGNANVTLVVVPGADHSMQETPDDEETRMRERISFQSFYRPYSEVFLRALTDWLRAQLVQ